MANFGFGFVEIGSLTPKPQDGNQKPDASEFLRTGLSLTVLVSTIKESEML